MNGCEERFSPATLIHPTCLPIRMALPLYGYIQHSSLMASQRSDFIVFSVEAAFISSVVERFGPACKLNAIVAGQTSVKEPEINAFEAFLPEDVSIVTCHSLHGYYPFRC